MSPEIKHLVARALARGSRGLEAVVDRLGDAARVVNFTRGLLEFEPRPDDVFVVTYPRSGTTLMQFLLHLLTAERREAFDHVSQVAPWFERSLAVGALTAADLAALPSPRIFKSHLAHGWVPRSPRTIYVTRDGRDVAISYYHFYCSHLRFEGSFAEFFARFLRGDVQYGSWVKHTAGWHAHRDDPRILLLRFEELVHALPACVERIVRFLALDVPAARVAEAIEKCRFAYMKQREERFDFTTELLLERGYKRSAFLRSGQTGEGKASLTEAQQQAFARAAAHPPRNPGLELDLPRFLR